MNNSLIQSAQQLRLSGLLSTLELRLQEATSHQLAHAQFLELLFQDELQIRQQRLITKRTKAAAFRDLKTLEDFDWQFNPTIKRGAIYQQATSQFVRQHLDVLFLGPPGVRATWPKPSATMRLRPALSSSTGPSLTWCATSKPTAPPRSWTAPWPNISSPIYS